MNRSEALTEPRPKEAVDVSFLLANFGNLPARRRTAGLRMMAAGALIVAAAFGQSTNRLQDLAHYSKVFGEERNFRVFLPATYFDGSNRRYPVIYFFHGHSERYNKPPRTRPGYDSGEDYGGDNIARFTDTNEVIVVKWDGYNPRTPQEDYPRPYNISPVETYRQFPLYFPELVEYIDSKFRTIADRDHRATAGLSMGGFMSYWVSGKYPHLVGSASNFMGSSEFYAGPNGFPSEYRHTEMYGNYEGLYTRLVIGSRDFIRWYHRRMNLVWDAVRPHHEHEEFDWDHGTPGMAKTLGFHMRAFQNPMPRPELWHHADVYPAFDVWGYSIRTSRLSRGFTALENVSRSGFRASVREWLPDGRLLPSVDVRVATDKLYLSGRTYRITDVNVSTREIARLEAKADAEGRLHLRMNGDIHEIGIVEAPSPLVTVSGWRVEGAPWAAIGQTVRLRLTFLNKGAAASGKLVASLKSPSAGVTVRQSSIPIPVISPGQSVQSDQPALIEIDGSDREMIRLAVSINGSDTNLHIPVFRKIGAAPEFTILDGLKAPVWERAINQTERVLGAGNQDGIAQVGESIVIGMRDGAAIRPVEVFSSDPCLDTTERVSDAWGGYDSVGATAKYTVLLISSSCRDAQIIPLFIRYQLPSKPEHILREHTLSLRVGGSDTTAPTPVSAAFREWNRLEVRIRDASPVKVASATLTQNNTIIRIPLNDHGQNGDLARGDGIFSGTAPNPPAGVYRLRVEAEDASGNHVARDMAGDFEFKLPPPSPARVR